MKAPSTRQVKPVSARKQTAPAKPTNSRKPAAARSRKQDAELELADLRGKSAAIDKSQAVIEFDLDGHILAANDNFLRTVGFSRDEVVGHHHSIFVDEVYRQSQEYKDFWARLGRGEYQTGEYRRVAKDGREFW